MKKSRILALLLASVMLVGFVNPVFAQGEIEPVSEPEMEQEKLNPILQLIADFFRDLFVPDEPVEPTDDGEGDPAETPAPPESPAPEDGEVPPLEEPVLTAEEIVSSYHADEDLGMGVMVKLLGIADSLAAQCDLTGENCDIDMDELVAQFKAGVGIGELTDTYGKPETMGVGHIKPNKSQSSFKVKNDNGNKKDK